INCISVLPDESIFVGIQKSKQKPGPCLNYGLKPKFIFRYFSEIFCSKVFSSEQIIIGELGFNSLKILNLKTDKYDIKFRGHSDLIHCIIVLENGKIVTGLGNATLKIWDPINKKCDLILIGHLSVVHTVITISIAAAAAAAAAASSSLMNSSDEFIISGSSD